MPTAPTMKKLLQQMLRIRTFEEVSAEQYSAGLIRGFLHLYIGEEAVAAGSMSELSGDDAIFATYREHGHALMRGLSAASIMAEMFGRVTGCCRGRGGSMHLFDKSKNFFGGNAIVAGALPLAVGMGLSYKMQRLGSIAVCYFGEGAVAEGGFHESVNLAALWQIPLLFICENNLYAMGTALERSESQVDLIDKAKSYKVQSTSVNGMDVLAVAAATREAVATIKMSGKPFFLECKTYRFRAHSMFDPELYRDKSEVERWKLQDPIMTFSQRLLADQILSEAEFAQMQSDVMSEMRDAVAFATQSELEPLADLYNHVYTKPS